MSDQTILPPGRPQRPMMIKGLAPSLPERGKIKIGMKGAMMTSRNGNEFQPPQKLDHFVVTTMERDQTGNFKKDEAIHKALGDKPTEIPIRLLYDDPTLNFPTRYAAYQGRKLWCSGDGETAQRLTPNGQGYEPVKCPCGRQDPAYEGKDKCKMNGALSALLDGAGGIGGVWKFRTTSYNSIVGLLSSMAYLKALTGGPLANIPLKLTVRPKQATAPNGQQQTVYVVGMEYGGTIEDLQHTGHQIALDRAKTQMRIEHIEDEARRILMLSAPTDAPLPGDNNDDVVEEYYPEQVTVDGTIPPRPTQAQFEPSPPLPRHEGAADENRQPHVLMDEVGDKMLSRHNTPDDWAKQLLAESLKTAPDGKQSVTSRGQLMFASNEDTWNAIRDEVSDALFDKIEGIYKKLKARLAAAASGASEAPPAAGAAAQAQPQAASADAPPPPPKPANGALELPVKNGKSDSQAYTAMFVALIPALKNQDAVLALLKREGANMSKVLPGVPRSIVTGPLADKWAELGGDKDGFKDLAYKTMGL